MHEEPPNFGDREFLLSRYADGDLTDAERRDLQSALDADPELAELLEAYRRVDALVRAQGDSAPELDWERFAGEVRRRCAGEAAGVRRPALYRLYAPLATAAAIAVACTGYLMLSGGPSRPMAPPGRVLVELSRPADAERAAFAERVVAVRFERTPPSGYAAPAPSGKSYAIAAAAAEPFDRFGQALETGPFF